MIDDFFSASGSETPSNTDCYSSKSHQIMLLSGPPSCGKTSLLFQLAYNNSGLDGNVTFICNRRKLENKPPFLSQGLDPASHSFHRIQIKYVDDDEGIKNYFSAFHLLPTFPSAVLIDDFADFFDQRKCQEKYGNPRGRDLAMVRTLALCHNAITLANESRHCRLVLSDTHHGESPRLNFIYKRWIPTIFTITGDGSGWFILKTNNICGNGCSLRTRSAKYSIALQFLILKEISIHNEQ